MFTTVIPLVISTIVIVLLGINIYLMTAKRAIPQRDMPEESRLNDVESYKTWVIKQYTIAYVLLGISAVSNIIDALTSWGMQHTVTWVLILIGLGWLFSIGIRKKKFFQKAQ